MKKVTRGSFKTVGAIVFFVGTVLTGLSITATPSKELLLAGMIIMGLGCAIELALA